MASEDATEAPASAKAPKDRKGSTGELTTPSRASFY